MLNFSACKINSWVTRNHLTITTMMHMVMSSVAVKLVNSTRPFLHWMLILQAITAVLSENRVWPHKTSSDAHRRANIGYLHKKCLA